jgi:hypothetical protein
MKKLAFALSLVLLATATTAATASDARACGGYGDFKRTPERAVGQWPSIARADGAVRLELHYPKFARSGAYLYMEQFAVVADRNLRRLERRLAGDVGWSVQVEVEEVRPGLWRVTGWQETPRTDATASAPATVSVSL